MEQPLRVIPDVNLLVRALSGRGLLVQLYRHFQKGEIRFVLSADLLTELHRVLTYPRVLSLGTGITPSRAFGLVLELLTLSEYYPRVSRLKWPTLPDLKDWYLLDLLWASSADALLTLDSKLHHDGRRLGMSVMTLEAFKDSSNFPSSASEPDTL